ncbi:hypothetical protein ILYODFUR_024649 [Ilyodon furcidens]|uniref:Uncharacterized protein n=1 Tax=Ilyodon furcidens TaxID=33524 RepID=A0ABV0SR92_9TELE
MVTSDADLWSPRVHPLCPPEATKCRGVSVMLPDKKANTLCPILVCFCLIHPSIIFCSSEVKSQRYQVQVGNPDIPLSRHTLQLITGDPKAFAG